jgi:outer membrane immunogenic protein
MRRVLFIAAVSGSLAGAIQLACAADMATRAPMPAKAPMAPMMAPAVYNWNGIYIGGHFGYGWAHTDTDSYRLDDGGFQASGSVDRDGIFGGGQIGVNWMVMPNVLLGVEGDISAADLKGSADNCNAAGTGCARSDVKTTWFSTLRGRIGYAVNNWLLYGTGGAVWTHANTDRTITRADSNPASVGQVASADSTHSGWTAGGGVEWGFAPNWSAKLEYLYFNVNSTNDFVYPAPYSAANRRNESESHSHTVRLGINYRFNWLGH